MHRPGQNNARIEMRRWSSPSPLLLSARRVRRVWRESAHSWEWRQRKGRQHSEGAVWLQDGADDRRRCHRPGGVPPRCKWSGFRSFNGARSWKRGWEGSCITVRLSLTERLYWIWRERGQAAGEGAFLMVCHRFRGADRRTGKDLKNPK